jgi:lysophospholipase L1-like esterase
MIKNFSSTNKLVIFIFFGLLISCTYTFSQNSKNILALGDSNGALPYGWVHQLQNKLPNEKIYNTSISGNTLGFDNLNREALNTLKNLDYYLESAKDSLGEIDYIIIMLGTNDAKYIFKDRQAEVLSNMQLLIDRIGTYDFEQQKKPQIIILSPPPYGSDEIVAEKYKGGALRVKNITIEYEKIAKANNCDFINVYKALQPVFDIYSDDGVHLDEVGQKAIANLIVTQLEGK